MRIYVLCDIPSVKIEKLRIEDTVGIAVYNFTNPNYMLEQADQSGKIDADNFEERDILNLFGLRGLQMLVIDAIVGNGDRHAGNFGWLRNCDTGEYVSMAPLYDFDHALDSSLPSDRLIEDLIKAIKFNENYREEAKRICEIVIKSAKTDVFRIRANTILQL